MSRAVLMSIRPEWCALITNGRKTVEVRKSRPRMEPPFKVYIYETKSFQRAGNEDYSIVTGGNGRGVIIGEFFCNHIWDLDADSIGFFIKDGTRNYLSENGLDACMSWVDVVFYTGGRLPIYGWHISDLVIYDEPKEVSEFCYPSEKYCEKQLCGGCPYDQVPNEYGEYEIDCEWNRPLARPPQSWCYVEEL